MGGGERIWGLRHEGDCINAELAEEALGSSKVRPSGLWELAPPARVVRGLGGLFAKGEENLCWGGGEQRRANEVGVGGKVGD